jgi:sugar O-acyltransferase (sialic acid O-acetyltransferase NeuD family)
VAKRLVIFGTGSQAELAHFYFRRDTDHDVAAFTVHQSHMKGGEFRGLPVVPFERVEADFPPGAFDMFVAVGYARVNRVRAAIYAEAKVKGYRLPSYVSPRCTFLAESPVGDNCFILEDNTIQPFVTIGNDVVMWSGNHIGHHSTIGDHCFVSSHVVVSGQVRVGPYCFLGVNATIRDSITIGEACVIGAGALIMRSTKDKEVYLGERSKPFPRTSDQIDL